MELNNLQHCFEQLQSMGLACRVVEATGSLPMRHLTVDLGQDTQGRQRWMLLHFVEHSTEHQYIQMLAQFPYLAAEGTNGELSRLLGFLNKSMDVLQLGYSEPDRVLYMKLFQFAGRGRVSAELLSHYISSFQVVLDSFSSSIELVACGRSSLQDLLETVMVPLDPSDID